MFYRESGEYKTDYKRDMTLYALPISRFSVGLMVLLFFVAAPLLLGEYQLTLLSLVAIAVVGALGLNILVGYAGQLSIGHAAFMSVGAYTAANLVTKLDMPFLLTLPAGGLMARSGLSLASRACALRASISPSPRLLHSLSLSGLSTIPRRFLAAFKPPSRLTAQPSWAGNWIRRLSSICSW